MINLKKISAGLGCMLAVVTISAFTTQQPQEPQKPSNLKVLPKNISAEELDKTMKSFNVALGVKCSYCHAPKADGQKGLDFASDAKKEKDIARSMMKMTNKINKKYFTHQDAEGLIAKIGCATCHNGQKEPQTFAAKAK